MVELSVIIVSWNAKQYLLDCLESIKAHTCRYTYELIVVDNASSDGSPDAVAEWHPEVKLIRLHENTGFAHANNVGIMAAHGRFLFLVNSDVIVKGDCFQVLSDLMESQSGVGLCGPRVLNGDGSMQPSCRKLPGYWNTTCRTFALDAVFPHQPFFSGQVMKYWPHDRRRAVQALSGCFLGVRRAALDQVGLLDENFFMYAEDVDWCQRFNQAQWRVVFEPSAKIIHFGGKSSGNEPVRFELEKQKANLRHWQKHHGLFGFLFSMTMQFFHLILRIALRSLLIMINTSRRKNNLTKMHNDIHCLLGLIIFTSGLQIQPTRSIARKESTHG